MSYDFGGLIFGGAYTRGGGAYFRNFMVYLMYLLKAFKSHRNYLEISKQSYSVGGSRRYAHFAIICPGLLETHYALSPVAL